MDKLPIYSIKVNESLDSNEGIDFVSLVDFPAIEKNWVAFSNSKQLFFNQDKQMLYGPILIPDMPIYRFSEDMGAYYVKFPESEVTKLVRKLQAQKKTINLNYQHQKDSQLKDAVIQEIWLTGVNDKSKDFGFDLPVNSAMVGVYIGDSKFWLEEVKTGNVKGFSIEGWLDMELKQLKKMTDKYVTATTKDGAVINTDSETLGVGAEVYSVDEAGNKKPIEDGTYELENGSKITVAGSKVTELVEGTEAEALEPDAVEVIQKAIQPMIDKINAEWEAKFAALKVELSNKPGAPEKKQEAVVPVQLSAIEKVKQLIKK